MSTSFVVRGFALSAAALLMIGIATPTFAVPGKARGVGSGAWKSDADGAKAPRRWNADVTREADDSISGRVTIKNHPAISGANLSGQISGHRVSGIMTDDNGRRLGTFDGVITPKGVHGTFKAINGDHGWWSWDGPAPQ